MVWRRHRKARNLSMDTLVDVTGGQGMLQGLPMFSVLRTCWKQSISSTGEQDHTPEQQIHKGMV